MTKPQWGERSTYMKQGHWHEGFKLCLAVSQFDIEDFFREKGILSKYRCSLLIMEGDIYCYGWDEDINLILCLNPSTEAVLFPIPVKTCVHSYIQILYSSQVHPLSAFTCGLRLVNSELASCPVKEGCRLGRNLARESRSRSVCAVMCCLHLLSDHSFWTLCVLRFLIAWLLTYCSPSSLISF